MLQKFLRKSLQNDYGVIATGDKLVTLTCREFQNILINTLSGHPDSLENLLISVISEHSHPKKRIEHIVAEATPMQQLLSDLPQFGKVDWLGVRPGRKKTMIEPDSVELRTDMGIVGDRYAGRSGARQVTLIQSEHLVAIAAFLKKEAIAPALLRRNIAISGVNLLALKNRQFALGSAKLEFTGLCHPCSAMQQQFGPGGYNAVRGHGGITARVLTSGIVRLGDALQAI